MKKQYSEQLETWEQEAYRGGFGEDWLVDVGEGVKHYAEKCEAFGKRPTFSGLMEHIRQLHAGTKRE